MRKLWKNTEILMKCNKIFVLSVFLFFIASLSYAEVYIADVDDVIGPVTRRYIKRAIDTAGENQDNILVIRLNTPGGLVASMETILVDIINAPLCIVVYVYPQGGGANSAGVFLVASADIAAMAPQTNIGSAHPVSTDGQEIDQTMQQKITNALIAKIKGIAEEKGRNAKWYETAVTESVNITAGEALENKVIDILARDTSHLLEQIDGQVIMKNDIEIEILSSGQNIVIIERTFSEKVLGYLQNPNLFMIFLSLGMLGLFIEITNPGLIFPGVVGSIFLVLGFFASQVLPISIAGLSLILLAFLFFFIEIMRPDFGIFGIGGIISFLIGGLMLFDKAETGLYVSRSLLFGIALGLFFIILLLAFSTFKVFRNRDYLSFDNFIGKRTSIRRVDNKDIYIHFDGSYWLVESDDALKEGDLVEILGKKDRVISVKKIN